MAAKMHQKFDKYWTHFSIIMAVVVVLDPQFKYQFVEWAFKKVYVEVEGTQELVKFKEQLEYLYGAYVSESSTPSPSSRRRRSSPAQPDGGHVDVASDSFLMDFGNFSSDKSNVATKSDLIMYLEEPLIHRATNINILYHWKTNAVRYPILSKMARDILAIPISTVASEPAFSTGGRVLDCYRRSLKPATA
ncbi:Zinc finger BED domain-containing protein RICESLEEPER 2 [Bienertia sinuspersici]